MSVSNYALLVQLSTGTIGNSQLREHKEAEHYRTTCLPVQMELGLVLAYMYIYIPVYQYIYSRFEHRVSVQRENHFDPSDLV